jgi:hypothetical protein
MPARALRSGDRFAVDGHQHVARDVVDNGHILWVRTDRGELVPVHETERVLLSDDAPHAARVPHVRT